MTNTRFIADLNFKSRIGAGSSPYNPTTGTSSDYLSSAEKLISNALAVLTIVGGIMFTFYFLLGGLTWITGGGQKDKVEKAKGMMTNGAIGIIIITVSYSITWIISKVIGVNVLTPAQTLLNTLQFN